jgi:hypothetical protein
MIDEFLLNSAKIVSTPTKESGSWIHIFSPQFPEQKEKLTKRGQLLAVISLNNFKVEGEITAVGKEIISRLQEEYYGDLNESAFGHLKKSVARVVKEAEEEDFDLSIGTVVILGSILYAVINDGGKLFIYRNGQLSPLLSQKDSLSGYLKIGDSFFLGSGDFFKLVDENNLKNALSALSPQEGVEILAPLVHEEQVGGAAGILFKIFSRPQKEEKEFSSSEAVSISRKASFFSSLILGFKDKILASIEGLLRYLKKRAIYLKSEKEKSSRPQKTLMTVAVILLALLALSVFFGMRQREKLGLNKESQEILREAKLKKEEGEALLSLNPAKSKEFLLTAKDLLGQIEEGQESEEFLKFKEELEKVLAETLQEHEVVGELFFYLEIIKAGAFGNKLSLLDDYLIILDKNQNSVYSLGTEDKKNSLLSGGEKLKGAFLLATGTEKAYVLAEEGILQAGKTPSLLIEKDEAWVTIVDMKEFSGNLYLLDTGGEIWKYPFLETEFGTKQRWLKEATNLNQALSMAIDGSLWVLLSDGRVLRFTQGESNYFAISGLEKELNNPSVIYTDFDSESLYLLDKGNSRIVVVDKSGEYKSEYLWSEISQANDLLVLEEQGKIFLLIGSKIFTIDIK